MAAAAAIFLLAVSGCGVPADLRLYYSPEQVSFAETEDGWKLVVYHLPPIGEENGADPVIMCHGFTSTSVTFDQGEGRGLGPYLAALGYDVWLVNLRGRPPGSYPGDGSDKRYGWAVDDYIRKDMPALLDHVCRRTGAKQVTWIGHSMGGMIAYARLGTTGEERVARLIAFSSPVRTTDLSDNLRRLARQVERMVDPDDGIGLGALARLGVRADARQVIGRLQNVVINIENTSREQWRRYLANGVVNVSGAEALQMVEWVRRDGIFSVDGTVDYRAGMRNIKLPLLAITGKLDFLAPPLAAAPAVEWVSSADKTFRVFGTANSCQADYGHLDILIGLPVREEVFPFVAEWLGRRNE